ncbi:MAG: HPr(Ser) kinase/phosphatase [Chlamydiia bacterium]|nr:HPr(Ser) kinase/phosphatase [Chlamydiia bacterium]
MTITSGQLFKNFGDRLELQLTKAQGNLEREIKETQVQRPGLSLAGYVNRKKDFRILLFGKTETDYLKTLEPSVRTSRLRGVVTPSNPAVILSRSLPPPRELLEICRELDIPLFKSEMRSSPLIGELTRLLSHELGPVETVHGTLVEAYGIGVLIQGESSVGKSEAALGLIERGHRLIADDVVTLKNNGGGKLIGMGHSLNKHLLELRGIGIINIAHLYGAIAVRNDVPLDLVIHLEEWNPEHYYDRVGLEERFTEFLEISVPVYLHPVKPGRDTVLLIETTLLNFRLKEMGYHTAKEFNQKLLSEIARKNVGE